MVVRMQGRSVTLRSLGTFLRLFLVFSLLMPAPAVLAQDNTPPSSNPASSASRADSTESSSHCERLFSGGSMMSLRTGDSLNTETRKILKKIQSSQERNHVKKIY